VGQVGKLGRMGSVRSAALLGPRNAAMGAVTLLVVIAVTVWVRIGPLPDGLLAFQNVESTEVVDRHGEVLYEARSDDGSRASWLSASTLPATLVDATIAAEDHRFFRHHGIDPVSIARAAARDLRYRRALEGGSTITQQVAKLLLARRAAPGTHRTVATKLREAIIALRLEHRLTKREILVLYLNLAPYGNQLTGAGRASQAYFGQPPSQLTPAQAALLASLPQRPSSFNPYRDPTPARMRQQRVIAQMGELGALSPYQVREAMGEHLVLAREPAVFIAPHFVQRVLALNGTNRPRRIQTTLDAALQREVEGIIRAERPSLERHGAHNVAAVVLDNATGEWLAWEGSGDYTDAAHGGAIDGASTPRQPGSALKPFTYALAFEGGASPATVLPDVISYFPTAQDGVLYSPRNYDGGFRGPLLARSALASSQNVPAVVVASRVGVPNLLRFLRGAGFSTFDKNGAYYGLGVTLGDAEVRLDEIVPAFAAFARGGVSIQPVFARGQPQPQESRLVSPRTAFWITDILSDDDARAHAFGRGGSLEFPFAVAAKTGTSQAYRDNWAIGYTRAVTVGVWVGNFDRRSLIGSSGVTGAGPIFHAIMLAAMRHVAGTLPSPDETATLAPPVATVRRSICALSGMTATPSCPSVFDEWLPSDSAADGCAWHRPTSRGVVIDWPAEYRAWASSERLVDRVVAQPPRSLTAASTRVHPRPDPPPMELRVVSPPDGAVYLIDPTLRREYQTIGLRATSVGDIRIEWRVDDAPVGTSEGSAALDWPLAVGRHVVTASDRDGRRARASIVVK
jgi:penicillin-binding protein 1C